MCSCHCNVVQLFNSPQISKEVEIGEGFAKYTLGEEVFISRDKLHPRRHVYVQALNCTSYKFSEIPSVLSTLEVEVSANQQYYWLKKCPPNDETCCMLLNDLKAQNKVSPQIYSSGFT